MKVEGELNRNSIGVPVLVLNNRKIKITEQRFKELKDILETEDEAREDE